MASKKIHKPTRKLTDDEREDFERAGFESRRDCGCRCGKNKYKSNRNCTCGGTGEMWVYEDKSKRPTCPKCRRARGEKGFVVDRSGWWFVCTCQPTPFRSAKGRKTRFRLDPAMSDAMFLFATLAFAPPRKTPESHKRQARRQPLKKRARR